MYQLVISKARKSSAILLNLIYFPHKRIFCWLPRAVIANIFKLNIKITASIFYSYHKFVRLIIISIMSMKSLLALSLMIALTLCAIRIKDMRLIDAQGRELLVHGGCVVYKVPPYFPKTDQFDYKLSFTDQDIEIYKELGMNAVRLGAMWAGVEPTKDKYDQEYLAKMVKFVNKLGENGIYTMLDFHQDVISQKFCGDGVPVWLIDQINGYKTFPFPVAKKIPMNASGEPDWDKCNKGNWGYYYFSYDVGDVFNHLYNPRTHLHKKYVQYWQKLARTFKGNPYVIAYQLINEPFVGNAVRNPALLLPSLAQRIKFQQFYDNVVTAIRKQDNDTNICFQPTTFDFALNSGFIHSPGGNMYRNKSILCYHYQAPPVRSLKTMTARLRDMKRLGIPVLMSEFGGNPEVRQFVEDHIQSYFYWQYKDFGKNWGSSSNLTFFSDNDDDDGLVFRNGSINDRHVADVARTQLQRTAGHLIRSIYRVETGQYNALYEATPGGTSVLYISKNRVYKGGYNLDIFPRQSVTVLEKGNLVEITYNGGQPREIMINVQKF